MLDENIMDKLPTGSEVLSIIDSSPNPRVGTVRIEVKLEDGSSRVYFGKGASGDVGYNMMKGSFQAETALFNFIPEHVPRPITYGTYQSQPDTHFYLCEFVEMLEDVPSAREWAAAVATLHSRSMGCSPTGKFGFPMHTHLANIPVDNTWNSSWEGLWTQQMKSLLDQDEALHGANEEFNRLKDSFFNIVIPRYLRPLESDGRSITPCLIHSDLWPGNIKPRLDSGRVCMFDSCAFWGHNEADLGICRNPRYRLGSSYIQEYCQHIPVSEPKEDFEDRNAVYAMKYHVLLSVMYANNIKFRNIVIDEMRTLVERTILASRTAEPEAAHLYLEARAASSSTLGVNQYTRANQLIL
ncbi:Fructosamine kinase-domain-containing protein [Whalleya microplaca]|nr:Fructosamine kinase-domain-containing protein [Whalleya microplaca]